MINSKDWLTCLRFEDKDGRFHGSSVAPLFEAAPFFFNSYEEYAEAARAEASHYVYWRGTNPTVRIVESMLAELEGGEDCRCFASGMAAIHAALMCCLTTGDHAVLVGHVYETSVHLIQYLNKFQISYTQVEGTSVEQVERAIRNQTRAILLESPTSLTFELVDLKAVAEMARSSGIRTIVDNSWATPIFQKPLSYGVDIVVHSVSKYLGGHNDLVGGAVIASSDIMERIFYEEYLLLGAAMGPFEAWLLIRGLRTLPLRMNAHHEAGMKVAEYLSGHPSVAAVHHPGLISHPQYDLGRRQLSGYGGLFSFVLKESSYEAVCKVINRLKRFRIGVSWGAMESQVISPNIGTNEQQLKEQGIPLSLIRLAVGHEPPNWLIEDLEQALQN
ncbi:trans-sulfuration enzyme family protein [Paenibacillus sp. CAA11]|uniref:trans-sulfuration enzyme family protein n=1 Tax=Paenibacillus sp. CAA11 TaxID=1532905 RepID=UPI001F4871C1|nr:PLP-dependent aspartate aminotransferase family protein [Paenibacillus sp. CAA11]